MTKNTRFSPEVRQRAIRMVLESQDEYDSQWAAICSIAPKIGCTPETLRVWVRQHERDTERLKEAGLLASTGSTGDSYDNAMAESINGLYKAEVIHRKSWKNRAEVELATLTWVDWYNNRRLLGRLGHTPPAEAEKAYYASIGNDDLAA
ncbi:hypothetical protein D9K10_11665 [Escherichia coli]|nr:hypothetical protein [Escherichia coli]